MINSNFSLKTTSVGILLSFYCAVPLLAEDIEIYNTLGGGTSVTTQPNVLFVLDTSGSMSSYRNRITVRKDYDPAITYADDGCGTDRIYWSTSGSAPSCSSNDYINSSALNCDRAIQEYDATGAVVGTNGPLETQGFFSDNMAQKDGRDWGSFSSGRASGGGRYGRGGRGGRGGSTRNRDAAVECELDQGINGSFASPTPNTYIENSDAGWSNSQSITSWPGDNYTIYTSNYINYLADSSTSRTITRFQAAKEAIVTILETSNNINIGLMGFDADGGGSYASGTEGGQVLYAIEDIATARLPLTTFVEGPDFTADAYTPLSETYYEAMRYFSGDAPYYGLNASPVSVAASLDGANYLSPIVNECQNNYIVFLTDGAPTKDQLTRTELESLSGFSDFSCASDTESTSSNASTNCLDRLSGWAFNNDVSSSVNGRQKIITNTVGFGTGLSSSSIALLQRAAVNGGGEYYEAQNPNELIDAFSASISAALDDNSTFSSPAVSVNAFNRSVNLDDLYFTLFAPAVAPHWAGNFKKYKLDYMADPDDATKRIPVITDANSNNAVDDSGFFSEGSQSFWSIEPDDADVIRGGVADAFAFRGANLRNVYTYTGGYNASTTGVFEPNVSSGSLIISANRVEKTNANITEAMLGITGLPPTNLIPGSTPLIETLLDWASGLEAIGSPGTTTVLRTEMGDPLHSKPALVAYGTTEASPELVAYVATNDGYLHAINTNDGSEIFSFIPQELLVNLNQLMENSGNEKTYGLDGDVVAWFNDINEDGIINGSDTVYLYIGMRRGGNNIYSLDVTDPTAPRLRWVIEGGVGAYASLGQTWSSINVEKVKDAASPGGSKTVLVFGGGYDLNQDNVTVRTADSVGNVVYIADAVTGQVLWTGGPGEDTDISSMVYSIPARVKPLDLSGDGNIDRLYVADTGGQIFRFDIDESSANFSSSSISGGRIADLAESASVAGNRRFYYPPDVALIADRGRPAYLALSIASGYRAHPNNVDIHDRIYMLKDSDVYTAPSSYVTIREGDLYNATDNIAGGDGLNTDGTDNGREAALATLNSASTKGWYIHLTDETAADNWVGEKGLSETLIMEGTIIVTTYLPFDPSSTPTNTNSCTANAAGTGKVYFMNVNDATPVLSAATNERPGRHLYDLKKAGVPPDPTVIITKGGEPTLCIGTECKLANMVMGVRRTYWYEAE